MDSAYTRENRTLVIPWSGKTGTHEISQIEKNHELDRSPLGVGTRSLRQAADFDFSGSPARNRGNIRSRGEPTFLTGGLTCMRNGLTYSIPAAFLFGLLVRRGATLFPKLIGTVAGGLAGPARI
jgi:hypothetical protein